MLNIVERIEGSVMILELAGQIDGGPDSQKLHEFIKQKLEDGQKSLVIDMKDVEWMNSLGAGILIAAYVSAKRLDAALKLSGITPRVIMVLKTCGLVPDVFEVYETVPEAIASF